MELCSIVSGSSGNCILIGSDNHHILVDVGISGKRIEAGLNSLDMTTRDIDGILITHEHSDHIAGLGVLARRYGIPIYTTSGTRDAIMSISQVGKIDRELFHGIEADNPFEIGDLIVDPIRISHDAADPVAYKVSNNGKSVGVLTDLGYYNDYIVDKIKGLDAILLEANHDVRMLQVGPYPYNLKQRILGKRGHLSNESAGQLLNQILHDHFNTVFLGHLSAENNMPEIAYETVRLEITTGDCPYSGNDFPIKVASREERSDLIRV